jgi:hypothetical protein
MHDRGPYMEPMEHHNSVSVNGSILMYFRVNGYFETILQLVFPVYGQSHCTVLDRAVTYTMFLCILCMICIM